MRTVATGVTELWSEDGNLENTIMTNELNNHAMLVHLVSSSLYFLKLRQNDLHYFCRMKIKRDELKKISLILYFEYLHELSRNDLSSFKIEKLTGIWLLICKRHYFFLSSGPR